MMSSDNASTSSNNNNPIKIEMGSQDGPVVKEEKDEEQEEQEQEQEGQKDQEEQRKNEIVNISMTATLNGNSTTQEVTSSLPLPAPAPPTPIPGPDIKSETKPESSDVTQSDKINNDSSNIRPMNGEDLVAAENEKLMKIKRLKAKLINEEHRLVLMKKIRQSQTRPINQQQQLQNQQQVAPTQQQSLQNQHVTTLQQQNQHPQQQQHLSSINNLLNPNPAKKLRPNSLSGLSAGGLTGAANLAKNLLLSSSQVNNALNQTPAHAHQRPKTHINLQQARQPAPAGIAPPHVGNLNRPPITTPPNVVQAMMGGLSANQQSILMNQINALTANSLAAGAITSNTGINSKRSSIGNLSRQQAITTPPNVVQDVRLGLTGQQQQQQQQQPISAQSSSRRSHVNNMSRQPMATPPNMIPDGRGNLSGQQSLLMNNMTSSSPASNRSRGSQQQSMTGQQQSTLASQHQSPQASSFNKSQAAQVFLQKRQVAKSTIQKQLEQNLMQLPEKRIQLGIDFIPNANNLEFVYYIGLEACVDYLTQSKNALDTQPLEKPFECSTCGTDFTPYWSWKRSNPVCENCVSNHVKKSIKNSQTNRIKSVLTKAAKQEQEMDQRIMAEATNVVSSSPSSTPIGSSTPNHQRHSSLLQPTTQAPQRSTPQSSSSSTSSSATPAGWSRANQSPLSSSLNRPSQAGPSITTTSNAANILPNLNLNNPLAALGNLGNLPPAALASLLQMNPNNIGSLASMMTANAAPTTATNNNNQIAQVAALLMNQLTMNLWSKR